MDEIQSTSEIINSFDGEPLYLERYWKGKPTKKLIILHGICGDTNATVPLIREILKIDDSIECITFDLRGHGYSTRKMPDEDNFETVYAKDLIAVVKNEKGLVSIAGHSYGGFIMQKLLEIEPELPREKLFFISTYNTLPSFSISRHFWFSRLKKKKNFLIKQKRTPEQHLKHQHSHDFSPWRILADLRFFGFSHYFYLYASTFGWKSLTPQIINKENVYFFYGDKDLIFSQKIQEKWLKQLPLVKGKVFHTNHNILTNLPKELAEALVQVLKED
ncbi:MAG: alpha/beta fold hydrolase [Patescibacteria group bacterium]